MPQLRTRKPTGLAPWPLIIVEGAEKTGKSYSATILSTDPRIGQMYWLDLGEGAADQYASIPNADYLVLDHNGTYGSILEQVQAVCELPGVDKDGRPNVLVIDSISNLWELLKGEADAAARRKGNKSADAEVVITMDLWNKATGKWRKVLDELIRWDGMVVLTARGKWVAALDGSGRPINGQKEYKLEGQKTLSYDADVILRVLEPGKAELIGARSVHVGTERHGRVVPEYKANGLAGVIFDLLQLGGQMGVRDLKSPDAITSEEYALFIELGKKAGFTKEDGDEIRKRFNVARFEDLSSAQAKEIISELTAKVKAAQSAATDEETAA